MGLVEGFPSRSLGAAGRRIRMDGHLDPKGRSPTQVGRNRPEQALARGRATFLMLVLYNGPWMLILGRGLRDDWARVAGAGSETGCRRTWTGESMPLLPVSIYGQTLRQRPSCRRRLP